MCPALPRENQLRGAVVVHVGIRNRPACVWVDARRPVRVGVRARRDERAGTPIKHVEKAILRGLHQHLAGLAVDRQRREDHLLRAVVVPHVAWNDLVVPRHLARLAQRHDRVSVQIIAARAATFLDVVRRGVAGTDVDQLEFGVVGDAIPDRPAAAGLPAMPRIPRWEGRDEMRLILGTQRGIPRYGIEPPLERSGAQIERRDVATKAVEVAAGRADQEEIACNDRRTGARVGRFRSACRKRVDLPQPLAGRRVDRVQVAIERRHEDSPAREGHSPVDGIAAAVAPVLAIDLGVVCPPRRAGCRVDRIDGTEIAGHIQRAIDHKRRGLEPTVRAQRVLPRKPEAGDIPGVDVG